MNYKVTNLNYDFVGKTILISIQRQNPFASVIISLRHELPGNIAADKINEYLLKVVRGEFDTIMRFEA